MFLWSVDALGSSSNGKQWGIWRSRSVSALNALAPIARSGPVFGDSLRFFWKTFFDQIFKLFLLQVTVTRVVLARWAHLHSNWLRNTKGGKLPFIDRSLFEFSSHVVWHILPCHVMVSMKCWLLIGQLPVREIAIHGRTGKSKPDPSRLKAGKLNPFHPALPFLERSFWHVTWLLPRQWPIRAWAERVVISPSIPPRRDVISRSQPALPYLMWLNTIFGVPGTQSQKAREVRILIAWNPLCHNWCE